MKTLTPKVGMVFTHPTLGNCRIIAVHPAGTIDVENIHTERCYRITGLMFDNARVDGGDK